MSDLSDPIMNCILEVCCGAETAESRLAQSMIEAGVCDKKHAKHCAAWVREYFDLAPKGSLVGFKAEIARLARGEVLKPKDLVSSDFDQEEE